MRQETQRRDLRDELLDATAELIAQRGYRGVRMQDIADAVGVSRQTVYNEFGDKWGLSQALLMRDNERYLDGVDAALAGHDDLHEAVAAAVVYSLETAADDPLKKAVLTGTGSEDLLPLFTTQAEPLFFTARTRIVEHALRHWPDLDPEAVTEMADAAIRLTISHTMMPAQPPEQVARFVARLVTRYLAG
jgi:AcrR family transcriptional regulator